MNPKNHGTCIGGHGIATLYCQRALAHLSYAPYYMTNKNEKKNERHWNMFGYGHNYCADSCRAG